MKIGREDLSHFSHKPRDGQYLMGPISVLQVSWQLDSVILFQEILTSITKQKQCLRLDIVEMSINTYYVFICTKETLRLKVTSNWFLAAFISFLAWPSSQWSSILWEKNYSHRFEKTIEEIKHFHWHIYIGQIYWTDGWSHKIYWWRRYLIFVFKKVWI